MVIDSGYSNCQPARSILQRARKCANAPLAKRSSHTDDTLCRLIHSIASEFLMEQNDAQRSANAEILLTNATGSKQPNPIADGGAE